MESLLAPQRSRSPRLRGVARIPDAVAPISPHRSAFFKVSAQEILTFSAVHIRWGSLLIVFYGDVASFFRNWKWIMKNVQLT